jgi:uncharacterized RDD family membrane protein YckC
VRYFVVRNASERVKYDDKEAQMQAKYEQYEEEYGIDIDISQEEFDKLSQEMKDRYEEADAAFRKDSEAIHLQATLFTLSLLILSVGTFFGIFIWHFIIPALLKNGQTIGKKCFSIAVMRTSSVQISTPILFIRSMLGLYAIETMVPVLMVLMLLFGTIGGTALLVIGLLFILQFIVILVSKTNSSIHDLLSDTVVVDMSTQKIFESNEALLAYKEELHAAAVAKENGDYDYTPVDLFGSATYRTSENDDAQSETFTNEEINQSSETEN